MAHFAYVSEDVATSTFAYVVDYVVKVLLCDSIDKSSLLLGNDQERAAKNLTGAQRIGRTYVAVGSKNRGLPSKRCTSL